MLVGSDLFLLKRSTSPWASENIYASFQYLDPKFNYDELTE